jgi:hypothetical protein
MPLTPPPGFVIPEKSSPALSAVARRLRRIFAWINRATP